MSEPTTVWAYTIPYGAYRVMMCLRCAKTYPEGPEKKPVRVLPLWSSCDKCHAKIAAGAEER